MIPNPSDMHPDIDSNEQGDRQRAAYEKPELESLATRGTAGKFLQTPGEFSTSQGVGS